MSKRYAFWDTLRPQSDCCRQGEDKVHILDFKTTWSEVKKPSQTAAAEAKPRYIYTDTKMYPTGTPNLWGFCQIFHDSNKIQKHYIPHFKDLNSDISALNENGFSMNPKLATLI